jgi:hypothetical protein
MWVMCVSLSTRVFFCVSVIFFRASSIVAMYARVSLCFQAQQELSKYVGNVCVLI